MLSAAPLPRVAPAMVSRRWDELPVLLVLVAALAGAISLGLLVAPRAPGDDSVEAGFARDMSVHHAQAVDMAETARERTADPEIRVLGTDIALTQQAQIGQLRGWLDVWGLPVSGRQSPMAWMGMSVDGLMPGMATPEQLAGLRRLPPAETDVDFLRLMVAHHRAGVAMANAVLGRTSRPEVRALAEAISVAQMQEIDAMQDLLRRKGQPPVPDQLSADGMAGMPGMSRAGEMAERGFAASVPAATRDTVRLVPLPLAVFALGWLGFDAVRRRRAVMGGVHADAPRPFWLVVAVAGLGFSALLHAGLAPEHFEESLAFGFFFAAATVALALVAAAMLAWPARPVYLAGAAVSLALIGIYALFLLWPPPGAVAPEDLDLVGVVTKAAELAALAGCAVLWFRAGRAEARPTEPTEPRAQGAPST